MSHADQQVQDAIIDVETAAGWEREDMAPSIAALIQSVEQRCAEKIRDCAGARDCGCGGCDSCSQHAMADLITEHHPCP